MLDRREIYRELLGQIGLLLSATANSQAEVVLTTRRALARARYDMTLVASDDVLRATSHCTSLMMDLVAILGRDGVDRASHDEAFNLFRPVLSKLVVKMRQDCFEKTAFSETEVADFLPFYFVNGVVNQNLEDQT